mmetsp:Transcript_55517/g.129983  ORF Transcript_55517/g.129983 Transcript_55517/m.129983 type:complete len:384 (+) Transcript_55517:1000-2151(+)
MHGIATRSEGLPLQAAIGCGTCCIAIDHIAGDGEHRECCASIPVQLMLAQLCRESLAHLHSQGVDPIVIVAEARQLQARILPAEANGEALLVPDRVDLPVADRGQGVGDDGQASNAEGHQPIHICVVQRHLHALVVGVIMRVVDAVHGICVELRHPRHGDVKEEPVDDIEVQGSLLVASSNASFGASVSETLAQQVTVALVASAIDAHQQELHQVRARAKELHVHPNPHCRDTAGDGVVGAEDGAHEVVVLILNAGCLYGETRAVALKAVWKALGPQHCKVRFWCWTKVGQGVQEAEGCLCHHARKPSRVVRLAWCKASTKGQCQPHRVTREEGIVLWCAQVTHEPHLDDYIIHDLLQLFFSGPARCQVALSIDVQEGIPAPC